MSLFSQQPQTVPVTPTASFTLPDTFDILNVQIQPAEQRDSESDGFGDFEDFPTLTDNIAAP